MTVPTPCPGDRTSRHGRVHHHQQPARLKGLGSAIQRVLQIGGIMQAGIEQHCSPPAWLQRRVLQVALCQQETAGRRPGPPFLEAHFDKGRELCYITLWEERAFGVCYCELARPDGSCSERSRSHHRTPTQAHIWKRPFTSARLGHGPRSTSSLDLGSLTQRILIHRPRDRVLSKRSGSSGAGSKDT